MTHSDDEAQEDEDQKEEDVETVDPVAKALVQLTKMVGSLAKTKKKEKGSRRRWIKWEKDLAWEMFPARWVESMQRLDKRC